MTEKPNWIIMPVMGARDYTIQTLACCLQQTIAHVRILIINQGVPTPFRQELEAIVEPTAMDRMGPHPRPEIFLWHHQPPLPSLAATWNRALQFVWETGGTEALVINNDVVFRPDLYQKLSGIMGHHVSSLFVSAVGVDDAGWGSAEDVFPEVLLHQPGHPEAGAPLDRGGPNFSCFLINKTCHDQFPFDEAFIPAYCEDLDYHRRLMLAGRGKDIYSVNLPFLHHASGTLNDLSEAKRAALHKAIDAGSRAHYRKKWGGPVNQETFREPFGKIHGDLGVVLDETPVTDGSATTPMLQAALREEPTP